MATERIVIVVTSQGAGKAAKDISDVGDAAEKSASSVDLLKGALTLLGVTSATALAAKLADLSDTYTALNNRLTFVTGSHEKAAAAFDQLLNVANESRSSLEGTVELYSRIALATQKMNLSNRQLLDVTETLNKAVTLSGATFREGHLALIQLSQGLASGTLRGDELRSVLEQLPLVGKLVADSLNVDVGALRVLASQGKITSDVVVKAVLAQKDAVDEAFGKTTPTIAANVAKFNNELLVFVGRLNETTAVTSTVGKAISFLANNIDVLAVAFVTLAVAAIPALITSLTKLAVTLSLNPTLLLAAAVFTLSYAITSQLIKSFKGADDAAQDWTNTGDKLLTTWSKTELEIIDVTTRLNEERQALVYNAEEREYLTRLMKEEQKLREKGLTLDDRQRGIIENAVRETEDAKRRVQVFNQVFGERDKQIAQLRTFAQLFNENKINIQQFTEAMLGTLPPVGALIHELENEAKVRSQISRVFKEDQAVAKLAATIRLKEGRDLTAEEENTLIAMLDKIDLQKKEVEILDTLDGAADNYLVTSVALDNLLKRGRITQEQYNDTLAATKEHYDSLNDPMGKVIKDLQKEQALLSLPTRQREIESKVQDTKQQFLEQGNSSKFDEQALRNQLQQIQYAKDLASARDEVIGQMDELNAKEAAYIELIKEGGPQVDRYIDKLQQLRIERLEQQKDLGSGYARGLLKLQQDIENFSKLSEQVVTDAFSGMEDAIVNLVKTGKLSFSDLVDTVLADLTRLLFRMAISGLFNTLASAAGGPFGGILSAISGGVGHAAGGPVTAGTAYKVGERGTETFIPQNSGTVIPNGAGAVASPPNITIINSTDPDEAVRALSDPKTDSVFVNKLRTNRQAVKQALGIQ